MAKTQDERRSIAYKSKPSAISFTVYDLQGDPLPDEVERILSAFIETYVKDYGNATLAISVNRGQMPDTFTVSVGTSTKVTNPQDPKKNPNAKYENTTFSRSLSRTLTVASAPETTDQDLLKAYNTAIYGQIDNVEQELRAVVDAQVQKEIEQYYEDNK